MMRFPRRLVALAALFLSVAIFRSYAQADGPYIIYSNSGVPTVVTVGTDGELKRTTYNSADDVSIGSVFTVVSDDGKYSFDVTIHPIERQPWKYNPSQKVFVMSDPHGNLDYIVSILQGGGVIDSNLHWCFGDNHLVIIGDVFDRGDDVTQICWLLYQLEAEANNAGGEVSFLIGNHEPMVLSGDLRYINSKYSLLAGKLGMEYPSLMGPSTELGRWLSTRNTVMVIGQDLFVHAGLSKEFLDKNLTIPQVNDIISEGLFMTSSQRKDHSEDMYFLFKTYGPLWYRGLVHSKKKYYPASNSTLDDILKRYEVSRMFVGHTIFRNVRSFYGKKVIDVNVNNYDRDMDGKAKAVLIQDGRTYLVGTGGTLRKY